jgi:hypothetical protein
VSEDGKIYNVHLNPPPPGVTIFQRDGHYEKTIEECLRIFHDTFTPIMDLYRSKGI